MSIESLTGKTLGRYEIRGVVGQGNMGVVYRAHDPVIDRPIALKTVVLPDAMSESERASFLERFLQEARTAGRLIHPNIVVTFDAATDEATGMPYIAMELIEGDPLSRRLEQEHRIAWRQAVDWIVSVARALDHAHREGVVHRDVKPANIMITHEGVPKVMDFGIAKLSTSNLTQTGVVLGTPFFMSPEQLRGEAVDGRSDLFSLGALLYTLVAGRRPFDGQDLDSIASQILYKSPKPPSTLVSDVPAALDGVIARTLMKSAGSRYSSGAELAADLVAVANGKTPVAPAADSTLVARSNGGKARERAEAPALERTDPLTSVKKALATVKKALEPVLHSLPRLRDKIPRSRSFRVSAILFALLCVGLFFREELVQRKMLLEASAAARNGNFEESEQKLEELLARNPDFRAADELLLDVSSKLVLPALPVELTAKHGHRLGSCTGRLTLRDTSVEYASKSHGRWEWRFDRVRGIESSGSHRLEVRTYEDDMLGLVSGKSYNFTILDSPPEGDFWKRYERLARLRRAGD